MAYLSSISLRPPNAFCSIPTMNSAQFESESSSADASLSLESTQCTTGEAKTEGLRHTKVTLEAREYKSASFPSQLLGCLRALGVDTWVHPHIRSCDMVIYKVPGSRTNAVFVVSCEAVPGVQTILLRIYGPSSELLISRPRELKTLRILSSHYHIGPCVYGTFENGRIEEYFHSTTLTAGDIRNPEISRWIGARMAELHSVDIGLFEDPSLGGGKGLEISARRQVDSWLGEAERILALPTTPHANRTKVNLPHFKEKWASYLQWLPSVDTSRRVLAHNDTQYGNFLWMHPKSGDDNYRQIMLVDFEYAGPNPAPYDIANHFQGWTANYRPSNPDVPDTGEYPTLRERRNFYIAYLKQSAIFGKLPVKEENLEDLISKLDYQVRIWSPASHAMCAMWAIVQARESLEGHAAESEFDHVAYSQGRITAFLQEIKDLGV